MDFKYSLKSQSKPIVGLESARLLTTSECEQVSGGAQTAETIVVTGGRPTFTPDYAGYFFGNTGTGGFRQGYEIYEPVEDFEPTESDDEADTDEGMFSDTTETVLGDGLAGLAAVLDEMVAKHGDFTLTTMDGKVYNASKLVAGASLLGAALTAHEGYGHYQDLMNGDPNVAAIVGFVGGLAVAAGAAVLGTAPLTAFAAGMVVKYGAEYGIPAITNMVIDAGEEAGIYLNDAVNEAFDGTYDPNAPDTIKLWQALSTIFNPGRPTAPAGPSNPGDPDGHRYPPGAHPW